MVDEDLLVIWNDTPTRAAIVAFVTSVTTARRAALRAARGARGHVRQRRHALVREADAVQLDFIVRGSRRWPNPTRRCAINSPTDGRYEHDFAG